MITSMKTLWSCLLSALGLGMTGCELDRSGDPADDADEVASQGDVEPFFTNGHMWRTLRGATRSEAARQLLRTEILVSDNKEEI